MTLILIFKYRVVMRIPALKVLNHLNLKDRGLAAVFLLSLFPGMNAVRAPAIASNATTAALNSAAQNAKLQYDLVWFFGGKAQRGWHLYAPLIRRTIGTEGDADSDAFAQALARWQRSSNLQATGVLDRETWMKMVSVFQSRRIKTREVPPEEKLFQAPAREFFDSERPDDLRYVERRAYSAYKRMIEAAAADLSLRPDAGSDAQVAPAGDFLKIISAFRSPAYQAALRKRNPRSGRAGLAVNSPHFTGRALDLYVGGEPVSTDDRNRSIQINTPVYQWLVRNAGRFGFHPYLYEPWHWEFRPE